MQTLVRPVPKSELRRYENCDGLTEEMKARMTEYLLSLHGIKENTKNDYLSKVKMLGIFLTKQGIMRFEDANSTNIDFFLSDYKNENTLNVYIYVFRSFYNFLKRPEVVSHLKLYRIELEQITPSEILTPEEIVALANEASKRRELYKILILVLFESCARIGELLKLKLGDVVFSSVTDKEGHRKLIATLHFKRSKGGVKKQPVVLVMFASELKRWVDNHQYKGDKQAWLFPSPYNNGEPVTIDTVGVVLWNVGKRLDIKKRTNPHWLRHSGLSFFANNKNYNEQLLMWRAGWTNTSMARRYIHSGAELEGKAYLERMGYVISEEKPITIQPKTCPHCNALNPYTNTNCDLCAMPLDLEEYKEEIEKRRNVESLYQNLQKIYSGKISEEQKVEINKHSEMIKYLTELGRDDLATQYIEKLLETWVKVFLTA